MSSEELEQYAKIVIEMAVDNVKNGGGPFSAIIVENNRIVGKGVNRVTANSDPTAHAEVQAIRDACQFYNHFELQDCILIASCEPCPMCFGASYWARLKAIYYLAEKSDASEAGFDDGFIYEEIERLPSERLKPFIKYYHKDYNLPFDHWKQQIDKVEY